MSSETHKLQNAILRYASIAVVLVALLISLTIMVPLTAKFKSYEERGLSFARETAVLVLSDYIEHLSEVSQILSNHYRVTHRINNEVLQKDMDSDDDLVGLSLVTKHGKQLDSVGTAHGNKIKSILKRSINHQIIVGPFKIRHSYYVYVATPIKGQERYLFALFDLSHLEESLHKKLKTRFGQVIVAYLNNDHVEVFSPEDEKWQVEAVELNNSLVQSLKEAIAEARQGTVLGKVLGKKSLISFSPVNNSEWGVAVVVNQQYFYSSLKRAIIHLCLVTIGITLIFLYGLHRVLRPLSGKLIMHSDVLEKKISDANKELKQANAALEHAALYDSLTDTLNRRGLEERILPLFSRLRRQRGHMLMIYLDVNKFKEINDTHGHSIGDRVLQETAKRLKENLRQEDLVVRLGGDEFVLLIADVGREASSAIKKKLYSACAKAITCEQVSISPSVSLGEAFYPEEGDNYDALMKVADERMYQDKHG